ncbi:MAG: FAD-dependent oxidoreductase [Eubacterium sp.]|nr:FAD-dependent oxidoreductase [Eubacterium sp.]MDY5496796.1 FAD-dependent oxidoreductase [Anaerobutyricum sp.]
MNQSVWTGSVKMPEFQPLQEDKKTDVLIIGGGLCGILCAFWLENKGIPYLLVEGNKIGTGVTGNTTAKITSHHRLIYSRLIKTLGKEKAALYLQANQTALETYRLLCKTIACDFEEKNSYVYSLNHRKDLEEEVHAINSLGGSAKFTKILPLPFPTEGAVCFPAQAQFHPLRFLSEISKGLNICENTFVESIERHTAYTKNGKITADQIIVATHFPFLNKRGSYFLKLYQDRSYVLALDNAPDLKGIYVDADKSGMSFRNYSDMLLLGGGSHRTGRKGGCWTELRNFASCYFPDSREKYCWATQDCMPLDQIPYIGRYSKNTPWLYTASGFQKWGMTSSIIAAMLLTDMILHKKNDWEEIFSPSRNMLKSQLFINMAESTVNLLTPTCPRCSHLGCALKWNRNEHTWDCPCHGSRFKEDGSIINNPAKKNLR